VQHVGQQERERLVADDLAGAPDGVAEAQGGLLAREARLPGLRQVALQGLQLGGLPARLQGALQLELAVEMVLDHPLVAAGDENEVLDAAGARLVHHVLDYRPVHHGQHLLRHRLGGGQEARAEPRDGENGLADAVSHGGRVSFLANSVTLWFSLHNHRARAGIWPRID